MASQKGTSPSKKYPKRAINVTSNSDNEVSDRGLEEVTPKPHREHLGFMQSNSTREAVVARLHNLELANQRLTQEKQNLQVQLLHVLRHVRTNGDGSSEQLNNQQLRTLITQTIERLRKEPIDQDNSKAAPLATEDYSGFKGSLVESISLISGQEYSSLSDAYEEICLGRDLVKELNGSGSFPSTELDRDASQLRTSRSLGKYQAATDEQPDVKNLKVGKSGLETVIHPKLPPVTVVSPTIAETVKNVRSKPGKLSSRGTEPSLPEWLFPQSNIPFFSRSSDSYRHTAAQAGDESDSIRSSSRSCSIFSSSSSRSSSPAPTPQSSNLHPKSSYSMPTSPMWPSLGVDQTPMGIVEAPTSSNYQQTGLRTVRDDSYTNLVKKHKKKHGAKQPSVAAVPEHKFVGAQKAAIQSFLSPGPPKVKILRRHLKYPVAVDESSDTTSTTSQLNRDETFLLDTVKYAYSRRNRLLYPLKSGLGSADVQTPFHKNIGKANSHTIQTSWETPISNETCPLTEYSSRKALRLWKPVVQMGYSADFLNSPLRFGPLLPQTPGGLFEPKDSTVLAALSRLISSLDSYTCSQSETLLLQRVEPPYAAVTPILSSTELICHSHESSDLTSEFSNITLPSMQIKHVKSCDNADKSPCNVPAPIPSTSTAPVADESNTGLKEATTKPLDLSPTREPQSICLQRTEDQIIIHNAILFRLSSRVKIWRRYVGILNPSSILFHTSEPSLHPPKRSILLSSIRTIRKPNFMSASITTGIAGSPILGDIHQSGTDKYRNGSVPVTRKLTHLSTDLSSRANHSYFELILSSGKTHRLRGVNAMATETWMGKIKRTLRAVRAREIVETYQAQLVTQGWLKRIKRGESCWVWCRLMGPYLIYAQGPDSLTPTGYKSLESTTIRTVNSAYVKVGMSKKELPSPNLIIENISAEHSVDLPTGLTSSSDSDTLATGETEARNRTITLWKDSLDPVYLVCASDEEFHSWKDNIVRASQQAQIPLDYTVDPSQAQLRLREYWHLLVRPTSYGLDCYHTDELIKSALSKTTEINQTPVCVRMFAALLFLSYPAVNHKEASQTVTSRIPLRTLLGTSQWLTLKYIIIRELANLCFARPSLKDELFLQLIKQATLSDTQKKRMIKREFPQRPRSFSRGFSLWCSKSHATDHLRGGRRISESIDEQDESNETKSYVIAPEQAVYLGDIVRQFQDEPYIVFPISNTTSTSKPEGWWPVLVVWECLCIMLPLFLPSAPVITCLQLLFSIYHELDDTSRAGATSLQQQLSMYAAFCKDVLAQTLQCGGRLEAPSTLEVASISIRNPYTHTYPFSIPIYLPNGTSYHVISFNGGSDFSYVMVELFRILGLTELVKEKVCLFSLYLRVSHRSGQLKYVYLKPEWKMCDVISLYEQAILTLNHPKKCNVKLEDATAELVFRFQAFSWRKLKKFKPVEVQPLVRLLVHQLHEDLLTGLYHVNLNGAFMLDLAAYLCRADHHDYAQLQNQHDVSLSQLVNTYFPSEWLSTLSTDGRSFIQLKLLLLDRWTWICKLSEEECTRGMGVSESLSHQVEKPVESPSSIKVASSYACFAYLRLLRSFSPERFSSAIFPSHIFNLPGHSGNQLVWIVPQEERINFLVAPCSNSDVPDNDQTTNVQMPQVLTCIRTISYNAVLSFGGQKSGAFFLVYLERLITGSTKVSHTSSYVTQKPESSERPERFEGQDKHLLNKIRSQPSPQKLRIHLSDLNAVLELTNILDYFINLR